jgi:hypothetical protein
LGLEGLPPADLGPYAARVDRLAARLTLVAAILLGSQAVARRAEASDEHRLEVRFEPLPLVGLQPESARLVLELPASMLPPRQTWYGFDFDGSIREWDFRVPPVGRAIRTSQRASASLGAGFRLVIDDPRRAVRFRMSVLPRAAVAVLSF